MIVLPCVLFGNFELQAATATNAYVTVSCSTHGVEDIVPVGADFYITTRNVSKPSFRADITVVANSPYYLVKPADRKMNLGIGEKDEYKVKDESGNEDKFSGKVYVLKLDIEPAETNVCWKSTSCTLKLTNDSFPGGTAEWTSIPAGISGSGRSITFNPNALAAGVYTVTARSGIVASYTDTCIVRVVKIEFVTPDGDPVLSPVDSGDGQNEFTFSSANPGVLTMNLKAKVIPASAASAITGCRFQVGDVGSSVKSWAVNNPNGKATVSGSYLTATVTFTGLPEHNSDFGKKTATASWNGVICDTNDYEVFFPKNEVNHPSNAENVSWPNWMYYWLQTVSPLGNPSPGFVYGVKNYFTPGTINITLGDGAAMPYSAPYGLNNPLEGIDHFGWVVVHESQHYKDWLDLWGNNVTTWMAHRGGNNPQDDKDGDRIPNRTEDINLNGVYDNATDLYDWQNPNTPTPNRPANNKNDFEDWNCQRHKDARGEHSKDWGDPGMQHKTKDKYDD